MSLRPSRSRRPRVIVLKAVASSPSSSWLLTSTDVSSAPPVTASAASRSFLIGAVTVRTNVTPSSTATMRPTASQIIDCFWR